MQAVLDEGCSDLLCALSLHPWLDLFAIARQAQADEGARRVPEYDHKALAKGHRMLRPLPLRLGEDSLDGLGVAKLPLSHVSSFAGIQIPLARPVMMFRQIFFRVVCIFWSSLAATLGPWHCKGCCTAHGMGVRFSGRYRLGFVTILRDSRSGARGLWPGSLTRQGPDSRGTPSLPHSTPPLSAGRSPRPPHCLEFAPSQTLAHVLGGSPGGHCRVFEI